MSYPTLPLRLSFLHFPVKWSLVNDSRMGVQCFGKPATWLSTPAEVPLPDRDARELRDELFAIPKGDLDTVISFLNKAGAWAVDSDRFDFSAEELWVQPSDFWTYRDDLRSALLKPKSFIASVAAPAKKNGTLLDLMNSRATGLHPVRFEMARAAEGVITATNARHALLVATLLDVANGLRFKTCKRKDCQKPFPLESKHKRVFCCWYCGHLTSVRKAQAEARRTKKATRRLSGTK